MFSLITKYSTFAGIFKLIFLVIIFIVILVLSYLVTKWYANSGLVKNKTNNIEIKESFQLAPDFYCKDRREICCLSTV